MRQEDNCHLDRSAASCISDALTIHQNQSFSEHADGFYTMALENHRLLNGSSQLFYDHSNDNDIDLV